MKWKTFLILLICFGSLFFRADILHAYTGIYGIFPPALGGPSHNTVTNFDLNTTEGPATIPMNLYYVQSMVIHTTEPIDSHILIKEYPEGSDTAFDVIVPKKVQDALEYATIYIWAPDIDSLVIEHEHNGAPTVFENATKIIPKEMDGNGNVLWVFTVTSFSSFTLFESIADAANKTTTWSMPFLLALFALLSCSITAPIVLRKN